MDLISLRYITHKGSASGGGTSRPKDHKVSITLDSGVILINIHAAFTRIHCSKPCVNTGVNVCEVKDWTMYQSIQPCIITQWDSTQREVITRTKIRHNLNKVMENMMSGTW